MSASGARGDNAAGTTALAARNEFTAAAKSSTPEVGQRTRQPSIYRWDRLGNVDLTIGAIASILRRAEQGTTKELVDLWLRMLKTDAHLASVWHTRISPVASARWELQPGEGPESLAPMATRLRDGCEEALKRLGNLEPLFTRLLGALGPGYAVAEIVWGRGQLMGLPAWLPVKVKPIHARRFQFSERYELGLYDDGQAIHQLREDGWEVDEIRGQGGIMARLPAGKYIVHQPAVIDDYPTATGLVHPLSRWWWAKSKATQFWLGGAEIAGNPRLLGKVDQMAPDEVLDELHKALETLSADGVAVTRGETAIDIIEGKANSSAEVWSQLVKTMDAAMSKAVLGSTLNVEIGDTGGNRAAAESQDSVTIEPRQEQDGAGLWSTLSDQLLRFVRDYNPHLFSHDAPLPVGQFVFAEEPVNVDQLAVSAGVVTVDELRESRGLPALGGEAGGRMVSMQPSSAPFSTKPAPEVATSDVPFPTTTPWDLARAKARASLPFSTGATQTSLPLPTPPSKSEPSA